MRFRSLAAVFAVIFASGCVMVQVGVTNPIPGLTTVAVAPFINLSAERAVDGRRFALTYVSELQKVPGFEVLPVGVTEVAMIDNKVDLNDVDEVLKLAKVLRVDAVVVGAITEYSPYYPPRIGMQVNWYSPRAWAFYPGIQVEPASRDQLKCWDKQRLQEYHEYRRQADEECAPETPVWQRMYRCFKRWPGVRNLYGEPTLAMFDRGPRLVRAQSPAIGTQAVSQPEEAPPGPANAGGPGPAPAKTDANADSDGPEPLPVKVAHYQQIEGMRDVVRQVKQDDAAAKLQKSNDASKPPGEAEPAEEGSSGRATAGDAPPAPLPVVPPPSQGPATPLLPSPWEAPSAPAFPDFEGGPPHVGPTPVDPHGGPPPLLLEGSSSVHAVRDPALAPQGPQPNPFNKAQPVQPWQLDPHQPLMAYTRIFDGADGDLVAALRDYVELNGDLRSGGWEGYLHRSDDFIRFTSYRMILEMLSLHGGEGKHRMIFKLRKYR